MAEEKVLFKAVVGDAVRSVLWKKDTTWFCSLRDTANTRITKVFIQLNFNADFWIKPTAISRDKLPGLTSNCRPLISKRRN